MTGMATRYWLMKCEPGAYTIDDLERDGVTGWEGVRNYQARNFMRDDMQAVTRALLRLQRRSVWRHRSCRSSRAGYPDPFAFEAGHAYFDPVAAQTRQSGTWWTVGFVERFLGDLRSRR